MNEQEWAGLVLPVCILVDSARSKLVQYPAWVPGKAPYAGGRPTLMGRRGRAENNIEEWLLVPKARFAGRLKSSESQRVKGVITAVDAHSSAAEDQLAMGQRFRTAAANAVDVRTQREKGLSPERSRHHWWEHKADRFEKIYYTPAKKETE